jgi:MFS family permease
VSVATKAPSGEPAPVRLDEPRLRDADYLVGEERVECDSLVGLADADDRELDATATRRRRISPQQIRIVAATYPLIWGAGQLATGWLSDHTGRKPLITAGMLVQAAALGLLVGGGGAFAASLAAAVLLGIGTAMVYPTLIAAVSDATQPPDRARTVGVYRFWRDFGFVAGALIAGLGADAASPRTAILVVAVLTAASGLLVAATSWQRRERLEPQPVR